MIPTWPAYVLRRPPVRWWELPFLPAVAVSLLARCVTARLYERWAVHYRSSSPVPPLTVETARPAPGDGSPPGAGQPTDKAGS